MTDRIAMEYIDIEKLNPDAPNARPIGGASGRIARASDSYARPMIKPLALSARTVENSSRPRDVALDLFLGSSSTLIACERTGRTCLGAEIDPRLRRCRRREVGGFHRRRGRTGMTLL